MDAIRKVRHQLMAFMAGIARPGRVFSLRDFNSQVMMNTYDPQERAALGDALEDLVAAGVLRRSAPLEYTLTDAGLQLAVQLRARRRAAVAG